MWISWRLPHFLLQYALYPAQSFIQLLWSRIDEIGYGGFLGWEWLHRLRDFLYTLITLLAYGLRLLIPVSLGLSFSYWPFLYSWSATLSLGVQGNNVDLVAIFFQYALPSLIVSGIGAFVAWNANRHTQKKEDIEYWQEKAKDLRIEFDKLKIELAEVKSQNIRYELAFMYIRNEPDSNPAMIRTAQAIIDGKMSYTRRRDDENES